jgi:uncharacterized protein
MVETGASRSGTRIVTLDVIRGIAVMGIFSVNVIAFAMIFPAYMNPAAMGLEGEADLLTWFTNYIVIDGKMRSLFSMLFGASMLLVIDRAVAAGRSGARTHFARMFVLALIGLAHFYFIWMGDILFSYAVSGMIAYLFRGSSVKKLLGWSIGLFALSTMMMTGVALMIGQLEQKAQGPGAAPQDVAAWQEASSWAQQSPEKTEQDIARFRSAWPERTEHQLTQQTAKPLAMLPMFLPETLALMLIGMAGYRSGFLTGEWSDRSYRNIALSTLSAGLLISGVLGFWTWRSDFDLATIFLNMMSIYTPVRVAMALGYAALIVLLFRRPSAIRDRFAAVGRCAFTNYLGTSILAAFIFYGDGLGLFGSLSRFEAWLVVPFFWLLMLLWSKPWLDRFAYGPFEWLWRSLARLKLQPMRKSRPESPAAAAAA